MMEENTQKQNRLQQFYSQVRTGFFNIMFELLKEKQTGLFFGSMMILISFTQLIGLIFEPDKYGWDDQFFLKFVINLCGYSRIVEAINFSNSVFFYWAFMLFAIVYIVVMLGLLAFMNYFLQNKKENVDQTVKLLRTMIILIQWIFYLPFFEIFISIMKCDSGTNTHYMDKSMTCFQGIHIFFFVVCILFLGLLFGISMVFAMLFNETQPVQEDCLSRMESSFEVGLVIFRSLVGAFAGFCDGETCGWILIAVFILSSGFLCYQYYKQVPYYNTFISILTGCTIFTYFWISLNALLMKFLGVSGHIVIIIVGIPLLWYLVRSLREYRIEMLIKTSVEKLATDVDALLQVNKMTDFSKGTQIDLQEKMTMIGIINVHIAECQNTECPCKDSYELFDLKRNEFKDRDFHYMHSDEVFLSHFIKKLYDDALNKFINSPNIHISYSFYLFKVMNNIHASLLELNIALKKKPSLQQQFTIFRYKQIIEDFIKAEHLEHKEVYPQLTNVIEFERLYQDMSKSIEIVSNLQVEFWTHLTTLVPDLNVLNELGKKIYLAAEDVDRLWFLLCQINSNYQHALTFYGEYLKEIRNHEHIGAQLIDRSFNQFTAKKTLDEHGASAEALFSDDTTVVHVSGNKESLGKIMNASKSLTKVFGYNKNEVVGHSVNIMMPAIFAKRHTEFMERFFKTGRQIIFYQERQLFASHRSGNCFHIRILVKQFPNLAEGIQYVGLIKPIVSDFEYIITDLDGVIDSFSKGIINILGITPNIFKDKDSQINIMLLAPDLIGFFQETYQRNGKVAKSKYRETGGEPLTLIVPMDFNLIAKSEVKSGGATRTANKSKGHRSQHNGSRNRSPIFKQFLRALQKNTKRQQQQSINRDKMPTAQQLLAQPEYVKCERRRDVQCEIQFLEFKGHCVDETRMLVFKMGKNVVVERENKVMLGIEGEIAMNKRNLAKRKQRREEAEKGKMASAANKSDVQSLGNDEDLIQMGGKAKMIMKSDSNGFARMNTTDSQRRKQVNFQQDQDGKLVIPQIQPGLLRKQTASMPGSGPMKIPYSGQQPPQQKLIQSSNVAQPGKNTADAPSNTGDSRRPVRTSESHGSNKNKSKSLQEFNADEEEEEEEEEEEGSDQQQPDDGSPKFKQNSVHSQKNITPQLPIQEVKEQIDEEDVETPRVEVTKLKLEMPVSGQQQREKISFLQDLKKQSFVMSDNSTSKLEGQGKLNITDVQRQEKVSFQKDISRIAGGNTDSDQNIQNSLSRKGVSPGSMVKIGRKQSRNNLVNIGRFMGDDEEPQDAVGNNNQVNAEDSEDDDNKPLLLPKPEKQTEQSQEEEGSQEKSQEGSQQEEEGEEEEEEMEEEEEESQAEDAQSKGAASRQSVKNMSSGGRGGADVGSNKASSGRALGSSGSERKSFAMKSNGLQNLNSAGSEKQDVQQDVASSSRQKWKFAGGAALQQQQQPNMQQEGSFTNENEHEEEVEYGEEEEEVKNQFKQRDTHKIKTNPKYICVDQVGSDEGEEVDETKNDDFWQLSSKEIDFREAIIKQEKKRLKKEKKLKDKENKKVKSSNSGEDGSDTGTKGGSDDDEEGGASSSSESSESSSEDEKGGRGSSTPPGQKKLSRKSSIREDDGDVSSVSTRRSKTERNHYILRMAIDEKFVPRSIQNLRYAAYLIFVILGLLSIVYYVIQISLFDKINQNIQNIHNSEERLSYIIDITLRTRTLTLVNRNLTDFSPNNITGPLEKASLINTTLQELRASAKNLKEAQTDLSLKTAFLSAEQLEKINPVNVQLTYKKFPQMPDHYTLSMWEAIMEIIVSAFRISTLDQGAVKDDQASVLFVMKNCLNSVLEALKSSTDAIITESETSRQSNMGVFLYLLIAASCSLFISLVFLIPVINKVKKNKQEVLELFTHKNIDRHIDDQLKVCRNFISTRIQQSNEAAGGGGADHNEIDEGNPNGQAGNGGPGSGGQGDKELQNELNGANSRFLRRNKKKGKGKKWKKLSNDFGSILLKFLLFIAVIEGYFLANFMLSKQFLEQVQQLTQELKLLISRQPVQSFLLLIQKELIYSNGEALIEGNKSESYVPYYHESVYDDEENLLDKFSSNYDFHSTEYNDLFNNVVYSNVCQYVTYESQQVCEEYNQGILKKGVYSSVIKYWDFLRQLNHDFMESPRNNQTIKQFLNDPRLQIAERMQDYYFRRALQKLVDKLEVDINQFFDTEYVQNRTIFIIYIFYILLLYFFIWSKFVGQLQNELWKTKSMLGILPIKVCSDIDEIRTFIISNSSNDFLSK